mmetsp:Transcript_90576/g.255711  ORF Transcript_90576/g.255711 Transcript_90576/m.255711 type:complete len:829 (+) Transcript_90576:43-2529(+)
MDDGASNRARVFARVRPAHSHEKSCIQLSQCEKVVRVLSEPTVALESLMGKCPRSADASRTEAQEFLFDGVFSDAATQEEVYAAMGHPVLYECIRGFNGTIFAYGQTGSGKTHSLLHFGQKGEESGLLPRLISELFDHVAQDAASAYRVEAAAMQVYNEQVDDLLHPRHKAGDGYNLNVLFSGEVPALTWVHCRQPAQLRSTFLRGRMNLVYAETKLNKASSRSHAIFQIRLTRYVRAGTSEGTCSLLSVVDLAGSERVKKSGVQGVQFKEATHINKSLLSLGNVVSALAARKPFVPYRDSKLTHILSPSIGANCKTTLLVCASPAAAHSQETLCSLEFASRAMNIEVNARVNRIVEVNRSLELGAAPPHEPAGTGEAEEVELDELVMARQAVLEAMARAHEAEARAALADKVSMEATAEVERAEARANLAEQAIAEWQDRAANVELASSRLASGEHINAINAIKEKSEKTVAMWQERHAEATQRIALLEEKVAQCSNELQERSAALCDVTAKFERLQAEMESREAQVRRAQDASEEAEKAMAKAAQLEADSQQASIVAKARVAAADEQLARVARETDLEEKLAQSQKELQQRTASLCEASARLERLQAEMDMREAQVCRARNASQTAEEMMAKAARLEADSQQALIEARAKTAAADEQVARLVRETDLLSAEREHHSVQLQDLDAEKRQVAAQQECLKKQHEELAQRLAMVEGLEKEKHELARKQKELDRQRDELQLLDRRLRNSVGPNATGPPVRHLDLPQIGTPPLPPVARRSASSGSSPLNSARHASKTRVHKKPSSVLPSASARDVSPLRSARSVSRTPPPSH